MFREQYKSLNENGFASIVIALILIIVLALLTVGFAQLARREQQGALDRQLSTQANDAAESGINDAYSDIQNSLITTANTGNGTTCMKGTDVPSTARTYKYDSTQQINSNYAVGYSCLLVNLTPPTLSKSLDPGSGWTTAFEVTGQDGTARALRSFDIAWSSSDGHTAAPPSNTALLPIGNGANQWGKVPALLEFSITPICAPGATSCATSRTALQNNALTAYLHPSTSGMTLTYPAGGGNPSSATNPYSDAQGQLIQAQCTSGSCKVTVNMSAGVGGQNGEEYLIHVVDYYDSSDIAIEHPIDTGGNPAYFSNSQAIIDVTGKAHEVLKRLQAVVPIGKSNPPLPSYGAEAQDLCKLLNTTIDTLPDGSAGGTTSNTSGLPAPGDPNSACSLP